MKKNKPKQLNNQPVHVTGQMSHFPTWFAHDRIRVQKLGSGKDAPNPCIVYVGKSEFQHVHTHYYFLQTITSLNSFFLYKIKILLQSILSILCVTFPPRNLNSGPYPLHPTNTYTCVVTIAQRVCNAVTATVLK